MNFITADDLQSFQSKYVTTDADKALLETYCASGMEAVRGYLGYNPEASDLVKEDFGADSLYFSLDAPLIEITAAAEDGEEIDASLFRVSKRNLLEFKNGRKFYEDKTYKISYRGGFEEVPERIRNCALSIAALYWERAGGNLAVNSVSLADGTRTFANREPGFFLKEIDQYRILVIG